MHFTVVFSAHESQSAVAALAFRPSPEWLVDGRVIQLHPEVPTYQVGDLSALLGATSIEEHLVTGARQAVVVIHESGHATEADLDGLLQDLSAAGFGVSTVHMGASE